MNKRTLPRFIFSILLITLFTSTLFPSVISQEASSDTTASWEKEHESFTDTWSWESLAWEFGPYPTYSIYLSNGTEVTYSNFIPLNEDFKVVIDVKKAIFTGNNTLGAAGLEWHMEIKNLTNPEAPSLGWAHLRMGYVNVITRPESTPLPSDTKNGSYIIESSMINYSETTLQPDKPDWKMPLPFYIWNELESGVKNTSEMWRIEIVGRFNSTNTPYGPFHVNLNVIDSSGHWIDFGYLAWEEDRSPYRMVAVGRPGHVYGGFWETWTFEKLNMENKDVYSVSRGALWKMRVNVTSSNLKSVTLSMDLEDNLKTYVNVTGWYWTTETTIGGWVYNDALDTYVWNSTIEVTRPVQKYGPHLEERWIWVPHQREINITRSHWDFETQTDVQRSVKEYVWEKIFLIYHHENSSFTVKQGYSYWAYDEELSHDREFLELYDLNTSDLTTSFYTLNIDQSTAYESTPGKWVIEFVGLFNSTTYSGRDRYWIQPPIVYNTLGDQIWADYETVDWSAFEVAVDRLVAVTKIFDQNGREIKGWLFQTNPGEHFTVQSELQGASTIFDDIDAVGVQFQTDSGRWDPKESYWSNVEIKLVYNKAKDKLISETYNRTEKSVYAYGPHMAWVEVNVTDFHNEYDVSKGRWEWVNSTYVEWNYTTVEDWHWEYWSLNQTEYALNSESPDIWINRNENWIHRYDPAFKVSPSYATLNSVNMSLVDGVIVSTLNITFNSNTPKARYWWDMLYGNLTYGEDYTEGWGEHTIEEWTSALTYYVNDTWTSFDKRYVENPSQPYYTIYNGEKYKVEETPYILINGQKHLIKTKAEYRWETGEDIEQYLLWEQWDPVTETSPRYYELINGTKIYVVEGYQAIIRNITLNCEGAYKLLDGGRTPVPENTTFSTFMDHAATDWAKGHHNETLGQWIDPLYYELLNGTRIYRDHGFEEQSWNSTKNQWTLSNKQYTESTTSLMVDYAGHCVILNRTIFIALREDGGWWQSLAGEKGYYLIMENGTRIIHENPWEYDDEHRFVTINGKKYTINWPTEYYAGTYQDTTLTIRGGWEGFVRQYFYTTIVGVKHELPYPGAFASHWDLENLKSKGGKIPTIKSIVINGVEHPIHREGSKYYILIDETVTYITKPEMDLTHYYSSINGDDFWNITQAGWRIKYGTYSMRGGALDVTEGGSMVTTTGYDPESYTWREWNKFEEDRENSTCILINSTDENRIDVYWGRTLYIWNVSIGGKYYLTLSSWDRSVYQDGVWRNFITLLNGTRIYFDWGKTPATWVEEIHIDLPGTNYTRLVPFEDQEKTVFDKTYIYNLTIPGGWEGDPAATGLYYENGLPISANASFKTYGTEHGPGTNAWYYENGDLGDVWIQGGNAPWNDSIWVNWMEALNGSMRIYSQSNFGWIGYQSGNWSVEKQWKYINDDQNAGKKYISVAEGGHLVYFNDTIRILVTTEGYMWDEKHQTNYLVMENGTRFDIEYDQNLARDTTTFGDHVYALTWPQTYYSTTDGGVEYSIPDQALAARSAIVPTIISPVILMNATSDMILHDEAGYYLINASNSERLNLTLVNTWWNLSEKIRKDVFREPDPMYLRDAYPRYNITLNGVNYFVVDPSPCIGEWGPWRGWEHNRYPKTFTYNGETYPISYEDHDTYNWRSYNYIMVDGVKQELPEEWLWNPVYQVIVGGEPTSIDIAKENIFKKHTVWGPTYSWRLEKLPTISIRTVMDIVVGIPEKGMWDVKGFTVVPETGALDLDGDLTTSEDQYFVRRIHSGSDYSNRTEDRMWVELVWDPNATVEGDEMHIGAWMGKMRISWRTDWSETYTWYYASNTSLVSPETLQEINATLIDSETGLPNPGYWEISRMAQNYTWADMKAKAEKEGWEWFQDEVEWEWIWFGFRQDYRTDWVEGGTKNTAAIGLQYEYAGLLLYNDSNTDTVMQQEETTHFFMPMLVEEVTFVSPGEAYGNLDETGTIHRELSDTITFGVTFSQVNGTLFPYDSNKPRDMWGWWGEVVYGADFEEPNFMNKPTESFIEEIQFVVHFNATTTADNATNNEASVKIDERFGDWTIDPDVIDGRRKMLHGNETTYLKGMEVLEDRSMAASWYVVAFTGLEWKVRDELGQAVDNENVIQSSTFDIAASMAEAKFATVKMGETYDWMKPTAVNDTIRTCNVSSYTTPIGTFRNSYEHDAGKSSSGFGITATMYFLTVGFTNWDGYGVYHDPELSAFISKLGELIQLPPPQNILPIAIIICATIGAGTTIAILYKKRSTIHIEVV